MRTLATARDIPSTPARRACWSGDGWRVVLLLLAAASVAHAIPPYRLDLATVLSRPCRVLVVRVLETSQGALPNGREERYRYAVVRMVKGAPLAGTRRARYFESYPYRAPDGKVEAPIYSGSGLEHALAAGSSCIFIVEDDSPETVLRVEPLDREAEIKRLLTP